MIRVLLPSVLACLLIAPVALAQQSDFRPPAVPLVACDPYFSVWSPANRLWERPTEHWTGRQHPLAAIVRVDGQGYRLMGTLPQTLAAMKQSSLEVTPTRSIYTFAGAGVRVTLTFTTPALPDDLLILSRPTTYINCDVVSTNDKTHDVEFYFDASGVLSTNEPQQEITGQPLDTNLATGSKLGAVRQSVLNKAGDDLRIDWGYLYVTAAKDFQATAALGDAETLREAFGEHGTAAVKTTTVKFPTAADSVVAAVALPLGKVAKQSVSRYVLITYDDLYSIEYMTHKLRPYWRKDGWEAADLIDAATSDHADLEKRCQALDAELIADLTAAGGREYADIASLAYRLCFAAGKFVADANGQPLQFCKENHSNGCIATSDVFYPMAPQFLLFGPTLTKSFLTPFMDYAASERWKFPFAPHDLGFSTTSRRVTSHFDLAIKQAQIERLHKSPNQSSTMVGRK